MKPLKTHLALLAVLLLAAPIGCADQSQEMDSEPSGQMDRQEDRSNQTAETTEMPRETTRRETTRTETRTETRQPARQTSSGQMATVARAVPSGDRDSSVVLLTQRAPARVIAGESFDYTLEATNLTGATLTDVVVTFGAPSNFEVAGANPKASRAGDGELRWNVGELAGGATERFTVRGQATRTGELVGCMDVMYENPPVCLAINAVQPALKLTKTAPEQVLVCDPIEVIIVVTNTGSGDATNVVVNDTLPDGLMTDDGEKSFAARVGTLPAGESRRITQRLKASQTGRYVNKATATADNDLVAEAQSVTVVRKPVLQVTKSAPKLRYLGNQMTYRITVTNAGEVPARDVKLMDTLPGEVSFVSADNDAQRSGRQLTWNVGSLAVDESKTVSVTVKADAIAEVTNRVTATAYCAEASAQATTKIGGIPAILLEMADVHDPIPVGQDETYRIQITNQGSAVDTNVQITCLLPDNMKFKSADGPTAETVDGQAVTFAPIDSMAPKAKANYTVVVTATGEGNVRFRIKMTSDQIGEPAVEESEATNVYKSQ